jgi:phenylalanyl-tRNA synthetase beta subunit
MEKKVTFRIPELDNLDIVLDFTDFVESGTYGVEYNADETNFTDEQVMKIVNKVIYKLLDKAQEEG